MAPIVAIAPHYERPLKQFLKALFPDVYWDKTHMECYNFFQQCKNHFATAGATWPNRVPFAAIFLKDTALFRWQQHQHKKEDETNVPITLEEYKAYFCQSLGESEAFIDKILSTLRKDSQHQLKEVMDWASHLKHL